MRELDQIRMMAFAATYGAVVARECGGLPVITPEIGRRATKLAVEAMEHIDMRKALRVYALSRIPEPEPRPQAEHFSPQVRALAEAEGELHRALEGDARREADSAAWTGRTRHE